MAGIALGNLLAMRLDARVQRPLRVSAAIELAIGLAGFAPGSRQPKLNDTVVQGVIGPEISESSE
jgi:hypothetical protein